MSDRGSIPGAQHSHREPITGSNLAEPGRVDPGPDATENFEYLLGYERCAPPEIPLADLAELAERIYDARQVRASFLNSSLLGEPVWDMLLTLFCQRARGEPLSVSGLCYSAGVPPTTALRWSQLLEQKKLIVRTPDASDARRAHLTLSDHGHALMSAYLASVYTKLSSPRTR